MQPAGHESLLSSLPRSIRHARAVCCGGAGQLGRGGGGAGPVAAVAPCRGPGAGAAGLLLWCPRSLQLPRWAQVRPHPCPCCAPRLCLMSCRAGRCCLPLPLLGSLPPCGSASPSAPSTSLPTACLPLACPCRLAAKAPGLGARLRGCAAWGQVHALVLGMAASGELARLAAAALPPPPVAAGPGSGRKDDRGTKRRAAGGPQQAPAAAAKARATASALNQASAAGPAPSMATAAGPAAAAAARTRGAAVAAPAASTGSGPAAGSGWPAGVGSRHGGWSARVFAALDAEGRPSGAAATEGHCCCWAAPAGCRGTALLQRCHLHHKPACPSRSLADPETAPGGERAVGLFSSREQAAVAHDLALAWCQLAAGASLQAAAAPYNFTLAR